VSFARLSGPATEQQTPNTAVIAVAPHLVARFIDDEHPVPIGDMWKTSRVLLPKALAGLTYRNVFTGAEIKPVEANESAWLFVGQALEQLPVALLVSS
jgi:maltooligosyltrehalose synthase